MAYFSKLSKVTPDSYRNRYVSGRTLSIDLASQPTMTRLENRLSRKELFDIGEAFIDDFIALYNSEPDSWKHLQRVVVKIEVSSLGTNVRYVVTDFKGQRSSFIYSECYCDRGRMEQMIAELQNGLKAERMSCNKFSANQYIIETYKISVDRVDLIWI